MIDNPLKISDRPPDGRFDLYKACGSIGIVRCPFVLGLSIILFADAWLPWTNCRHSGYAPCRYDEQVWC